MRKKGKEILWFCLGIMLLGISLVLSGCIGAAGKSNTDSPEPVSPTASSASSEKVATTDSAQKAATVGMDNCAQCHYDITTKWLTGAHGNLEAIDHQTHAPVDLGLNSDGFPYYGYFSDSTCKTCHDPLKDGMRQIAGYTGNVPRPVIGCESCHGGGAEHFGIGKIPKAHPGPAVCGQCHNKNFPESHLPYHPNGARIYEQFLKSPHNRSLNDVASKNGTVKPVCSRCHTDQGFQKLAAYVPGTDDKATIIEKLSNMPKVKNAKPVQCRTCHNAHTTNKNQLEVINGSTVAGAWQSAQYNTCTSCHQLSGADGLVIVGAFHEEAGGLPTNHAGVAGANGDQRLNTGPNAQALYFVNKKDEHSCAGCHNPHRADLTINRQYARSGHGDALADPWTHYDWKHSSRRACQRCHTSTGFKNFANAMINDTTYDPALNDFSYLAGNDDPNPINNTNDQLETLYCWACHTDYKGGLRTPPPFNTKYGPYKVMDGTTVTFPDASGSNVCIACHSGRESGGNIYNSTQNFANLSFRNSHYLPAGGVMFKTIGYEYPSRDYTNVSYYEHDQIGIPPASAPAAQTALTEAMGANGPCVGCHMHSNPEMHLFSPVVKDGETITKITSKGCAVCHTGQYEMTVEKLTEEKEGYEAALEALEDQMNVQGFCWRSTHPYIFIYTGGVCTTSPVSNWTGGVPANGKPNMGACFNMNMLKHEPGAYVHNSYYTKRLIYDSIDWLDNLALDGSVYGTLNSLDPVAYPYKDKAMAYLLVSNTNTVADRP